MPLHGVSVEFCVSIERSSGDRFYSRQMKDCESRYSATEIEALAMLPSILQFAYYPVGTSFTVYIEGSKNVVA